ncbi:MAG TPA: PilZ domain-containing protein [Planctomycetota bacterium]|nr:PilZ domain-containing protein [Planctomycetota bacterium]
MSDPLPTSCQRCLKPLAATDFEHHGAMLLLGRAYCSSCLEAMTPTCHLCRKALHDPDFARGLAVTLQGVRFCDGCMEQAVRSTPASAVLRVEKPDLGGRSRRASVRFVPPQETDLTLKPVGLKRFLSSNLVRLWIDVSEGGLRCIVQGHAEVGDLFQGRLTHPELEDTLGFQGLVRHARPSERMHGCCLIGLRFEEPSSLLQAFIRDVLGRDPGMRTLNPPTPKPRPPSTRSA